jgi:hypothetical protein
MKQKKASIVSLIKKFFFEFLIVTLGILTAFNINKWDENKKLVLEEQESYKALKSDLKSDLYVLNFYKERFVKNEEYLTPIHKRNYDRIDSVEIYLENSFDLQEGNATYVNLKYSGKFGIFKNDTLRRGLIMYYETYYQGLETMSNTHKELVATNITPYLIKNMNYEGSPSSQYISTMLEKHEFRNIIKYQLLMSVYNISVIDKTEKLANKIIERIDIELGINE